MQAPRACQASDATASPPEPSARGLLPSASEPSTGLPPAEITCQIVVGAVAGATPFVVAGVEFSKRIIEQKKCEICGGSGLVVKNDLYVRCQGCGGFLPWQSWRRFFKG